MVKERGILFSAPMVRALLAGEKTQTRRALRDGLAVTDVCGGGVEPVVWWPRDARGRDAACPYGVPGDRLWVRETWASGDHWYGIGVEKDPPWVIRYRADNSARFPGVDDRQTEIVDTDGWSMPEKWRPSIFMPRSFSRITLEVTDVRVQRLQDISEEDARAEGPLFAMDEEQTVLVPHLTPERNHGCVACRGLKRGIPELCHDSLRGKGRPFACWYATLWDSINGTGSWEANPWVWAISFRRIQP